MVTCADFRLEYSDYRDGLMSPTRSAEVEAHLATCASCGRYDRAVGTGVAELRTLPTLSASSDFLPRLQHRLYHLEEERSLWSRPTLSGTSTGFVVMLVLLIGAAAWAPLLRGKPPVVELAPVVAHAPHRVEALQSLFRAGPLLDHRGPSSSLASSTMGSVFFRYTPLGIHIEPTSALHRQVDLRSR